MKSNGVQLTNPRSKNLITVKDKVMKGSEQVEQVRVIERESGEGDQQITEGGQETNHRRKPEQ